MSYENLLAGLHTNNIVSNPANPSPPTSTPAPTQVPIPSPPTVSSAPLQLFTVETFKTNLKEKTANKNKQYADYSTNINALI